MALGFNQPSLDFVAPSPYESSSTLSPPISRHNLWLNVGLPLESARLFSSEFEKNIVIMPKSLDLNDILERVPHLPSIILEISRFLKRRINLKISPLEFPESEVKDEDILAIKVYVSVERNDFLRLWSETIEKVAEVLGEEALEDVVIIFKRV